MCCVEYVHAARVFSQVELSFAIKRYFIMMSYHTLTSELLDTYQYSALPIVIPFLVLQTVL